MNVITQHAADIVVLLVLAAIVALIIRGMLRGSIKSCDGDCSSCGSVCASPKITISDEDLARIRALREESERDA